VERRVWGVLGALACKRSGDGKVTGGTNWYEPARPLRTLEGPPAACDGGPLRCSAEANPGLPKAAGAPCMAASRWRS